MNTTRLCPICSSTDIAHAYENNKESLARYGLAHDKKTAQSIDQNLKISIRECKSCGFGWNTKYDADKVDYQCLDIHEAASHSPQYQKYQKEKAKWLSHITTSVELKAIEIGGGNGYFISQMDAKEKIVYEPSNESNQIPKDITVINKYFNPNVDTIHSDIVIMRQVLEHVPNPHDFIVKLIQSNNVHRKSKSGYLYIEVPSFEKTKEFSRFYDFYYEHCNYFSLQSLACLAKSANARVLHLESCYNREINTCLMTFGSSLNKSDCYVDMQHNLQCLIKEKLNAGKKVVMWGASGNGSAILNKLNISSDHIQYVIDSDLNKSGKFIPVTGQKIVLPTDPSVADIDCIFICTQFHTKEIASQCRLSLGNSVEIYSASGELQQ